MYIHYMVPNTNDGTQSVPYLRRYLNLMALDDLPEWSGGPQSPHLEDRLRAIRQAGYDGVQTAYPMDASSLALCRKLGLGLAGSGRINEPRDAEILAVRCLSEGMECATVHAGWGMEDDYAAARLIEAVLEASSRHRLPLYIETHRATIFQDMWRTVQFIRRFPDVRVNGDFSHWYTGLEMVYGGFERKLEFIQPLLDRVRFLHGRIGNPGCIQVDIGDGDPRVHAYVAHFRQMWKAAFVAFLQTAGPGDYICFAPELLASRIYYARTFADGAGRHKEESDRWEQCLVLAGIAAECFSEAQELRRP